MRSYMEGKVAAPDWKTEINGRKDPLRRPRATSLLVKLGINFARLVAPLGSYISLAD
jgi:hypothetical protein